MAQIDPNGWYMLTETRVDFNSSFQYNGLELFFGGVVKTGDGGQLWQFLSIPDGQWQIRNIASNINQQLATCYVSSEASDTKTQPCMQPSSADTSQKWIIDAWGDGTFKFVNVGNGSGYNMDVHPDNPPFMSDQIAQTPNEPAQHWEFSSIRDVNDGTYSTTFSSVAPSTTATASSSRSSLFATSSSSSSNASNSSTLNGNGTNGNGGSSHSGISTAAAIGIGVAVGLAAACFIVLVLILRRRQHLARNTQNELPGEYGNVEIYTKTTPSTVPTISNSEQYTQELYVPPAELPGEHLPREIGISSQAAQKTP